MAFDAAIHKKTSLNYAKLSYDIGNSYQTDRNLCWAL
jgi:hypothetical protein